MPKKKKILYHSDFSLLKTGFGKAARLILTHLYKTGKYDIVHFCCGLSKDHQEFSRLPWKSIGALPTTIVNERDPKVGQMAAYGAFSIDRVMKEEKPDIYIGVQDIWGCDFAIEKPWFVPENMAIWTTLDSLPILPSAVEAASKTKNFWCWSDFATKSLHEIGHKHVKTLRGPLNTSDFHKLDEQTNGYYRKLFSIPEEAFVVGFVFRNQLRKSVPNLLEGYKKFLDANPEAKEKGSKLLLHTNFSEGWGIHKLADEYGLDKNDILTTYICSKCNSFGVHPFKGQSLKCPHCESEKSYSTTGIQQGVTESQLNQVYNLMDVYCHPFTSGGQEIPIQEAKLAELVTLVTNYSCGEDNCVEGSGSLSLEWSEYREHGTEFIKASTDATSIAYRLRQVYNMRQEERVKMGEQAREWVKEHFATEVVGKQIEEFIDSAPSMKMEAYDKKTKYNAEAEIDEELEDGPWLISMYKLILGTKVDENDSGYKYWMQEIGKGIKREDIQKYFREVARKEGNYGGAPGQTTATGGESHDLSDVIDDEHKDCKRICFCIPESVGDVYMCTSLFKSIKEQYPDYKLYVATHAHFKCIIDGNPYVDKVIEWVPQMENIHYLEGWGNRHPQHAKSYNGMSNHKGWFDVALLPYIHTQRLSNYTHNGLDKIAFDIHYDKGDN
tara:strand:- start:615 stop:2615 length:2001 start_codon:yes stop_codon:yes gene_type:complete